MHEEKSPAGPKHSDIIRYGQNQFSLFVCQQNILVIWTWPADWPPARTNLIWFWTCDSSSDYGRNRIETRLQNPQSLCANDTIQLYLNMNYRLDVVGTFEWMELFTLTSSLCSQEILLQFCATVNGEYSPALLLLFYHLWFFISDSSNHLVRHWRESAPIVLCRQCTSLCVWFNLRDSVFACGCESGLLRGGFLVSACQWAACL